MIVRQKAHESASALIGFDASLEIGLAGSRGDLARDDGRVLDVAKFCLKGSNNLFEATLTDVLAVLNCETIDHDSAATGKPISPPHQCRSTTS